MASIAYDVALILLQARTPADEIFGNHSRSSKQHFVYLAARMSVGFPPDERLSYRYTSEDGGSPLALPNECPGAPAHFEHHGLDRLQVAVTQ